MVRALARLRGWPLRRCTAVTLTTCAVAYWALVSLDSSLHERWTLAALLAAIALVATLGSVEVVGSLRVSASFAASMLAVAFVGVIPAIVVACAAELEALVFERRRLRVLVVNVLGTVVPNAVAALVFEAWAPRGEASFYVALAVVACLALTLNFLIVVPMIARFDRQSVGRYVRAQRQMLPPMALCVVFTLAASGIYRHLGIGTAVFVLFVVVAFTYAAHLVILARERARQYASLSWGVLGGLLRMLEVRDPAGARHAAAVAAFARDIAGACGFDERDRELAHVAGLLHDVGRFAASDRVHDRDGVLTMADWSAIQGHPDLGASTLGELGHYGPVAEIVAAHHERVDGRGYPRGLHAHQIPELAKIIAVAETYDTLTARDTYRVPVSSFQALTELRRVSGTQLDGRYVEALAELLHGEGLTYRHADSASFERELDIGRRIDEATA